MLPRLDPGPLGFRLMTLDDLPLMSRWLEEPHVAMWWLEGPKSEEHIVAKYGARILGEVPTQAYIIIYDGTPIGYIQSYRMADYPEYADALDCTEEAAGIDLFIGDPAFVHRGLGAHLIRSFLRNSVFADSAVVSCLIGPSIRNTAAIRTYERAGFHYTFTARVAGEAQPEYVMRIAREEVTEDDSEKLLSID